MIANYAIIYKNVYMKKEHTRKNNNKNIIIAVLIAIAALIAMWFALVGLCTGNHKILINFLAK